MVGLVDQIGELEVVNQSVDEVGYLVDLTEHQNVVAILIGGVIGDALPECLFDEFEVFLLYGEEEYLSF